MDMAFIPQEWIRQLDLILSLTGVNQIQYIMGLINLDYIVGT